MVEVEKASDRVPEGRATATVEWQPDGPTLIDGQDSRERLEAVGRTRRDTRRQVDCCKGFVAVDNTNELKLVVWQEGVRLAELELGLEDLASKSAALSHRQH